MSLFLGPIHHLLYGKIQFQSEFANYLISKCGDSSQTLARLADENYPAPPIGHLEEVVDTSNIHGSLQIMVTAVEKRLAFVTSQIISQELLSDDDMLNAAFEFGAASNFENPGTAQKAYMAISGKLLNGMPCDRVEQIVSKSDDEMVWYDAVDIRGEYWQEHGLDSKIFYKMRSQILAGMLQNSSFKFFIDDKGQYTLRRI